MVRRAILLGATALSGCLSYRPPPPLEARPEPPAPIRIYVPADSAAAGQGSEESGFPLSPHQVAVLLEEAGFEPVVVVGESDVPPDGPFVAQGRGRWGECPGTDRRLSGVLMLLTVGLSPQFACLAMGYQFEFHRSVSAPVQGIDTRWPLPMIFGWLAVPVGWFEGYDAAWIVPPSEYTGDRMAPALRAALLDALRGDPPAK